MMFLDLIDVLTCSNLTCPNAPLWYSLGVNWTAHLGLGAALGRLFYRRWAWPVFAAFVLKEAAFDIPRNPVLSVMTDSTLDLAAMALGLWVLAQPRQKQSTAPINPLTPL